MAINKKLGHVSQNWDAEPESTVESGSVIEPQPGDLVEPKYCFYAVLSPKHQGLYTSTKAASWDKEFLKKTAGKNAVKIGDVYFTSGIYVGQVHLNDARKMKTGSHWTSTRTVKGLVRTFHIFMFGQHKVIMELNEVSIIQHFDDSNDDDE